MLVVWLICNASDSMSPAYWIFFINAHNLLQDVHDRALFYYRLLQHDVSVAERVINPPKQAVSVFADTQSSEVKDRIFDEFNSLSVIYQEVIFWISSFSIVSVLHVFWWMHDVFLPRTHLFLLCMSCMFWLSVVESSC